MFLPFHIALLVVLWIEAVVGILFNAFIVAVIAFWWFQSGKVKTIDFILACLGLSRLTLIIVFVIVAPWISFTTENLLAPSMFVTFCSLWFATQLCFVYCLKICNYFYCVLVYLENKVFRMMLWTLFTSVTPSLIFSLPFQWIVFTRQIINITNTSDGLMTVEKNYNNQLILYFAGTSVPFFLFCIEISLLIRSLQKHTRHMARDNAGFSKAQLQAHIRAVRTMVSFLVIYIIFFISSTFKFVPSMINNTTVQLLLNVIICWYPTMHSVVLVVMNRKMKLLLYHFLCCLRKKNSTEST